MGKGYKDTLNLPKTAMPMKQKLRETEEKVLDYWQKIKLEEQIFADSHKNHVFILHDGPPYPNGDIHLGHALNKILKDIVNRSQFGMGKHINYVPGWDCHGLPIENQLLKDHPEYEEKPVMEFREKCKEYALTFVSQQREQFIRLGVIGKWKEPYLTLHPEYEAKVIALFAQIAEHGLVYKGERPIHWCPMYETALAEAEIEYKEHKSPSIYVKFPLKDKKYSDKPENLLVWTTTPWTLPANVAVAAHPDFTYLAIDIGNEVFILVEELLEEVAGKVGWKDYKIIKKFSGKELLNREYTHPFHDKFVHPKTKDKYHYVINVPFVTVETGTGLVHIAPGHGADDYAAGIEYNLPTIMPVDEKGKFTDMVGEWLQGKFVFDADKDITKYLESIGNLLNLEFIAHAYPFCWRSKEPVIFRSTPQWFIDVDKIMPHTNKTLRQTVLEIIRDIQWVPDWGEKRITGMLETRPDWCISRQRRWGIPLPIITCGDCGAPQFTSDVFSHIIEIIYEKGSNVWFEEAVTHFLPSGYTCSCGSTSFIKENNIMDVWMESGASHAAVLNEFYGLPETCDMYLEGSDQHRGWFQSSLLTALATSEKSPFKIVLTHGFVVDEKSHKMSKSLGNVINPQDVINESGADILRLWVSLCDYRNDVSISDSILKQIRDKYLKLRNTFRFMLSNLFDYDLSYVPSPTDLSALDLWILKEHDSLITDVVTSYTTYEFHKAIQRIHGFCTTELSSLYLDVKKDILYCNKKDDGLRKNVQYVLYILLKDILILLAPILSFTAEDVWGYLRELFSGSLSESVHTQHFPPLLNIDTPYDDTFYAGLFVLRDDVYKEIEQMRGNKTINSPLEACVILNSQFKESVEAMEGPVFFNVSQIQFSDAVERFTIEKADGEKCERCWKIQNVDSSGLCARCGEAV
ncbi:isoleucine--tRNA ligase [Candidatus Margulisiibacteriota bacterium]